ncbi:hypothetical protein TrST_g4790 [Triparma strigata]|uniref:Uncharacterized protein n=1 Tax=Triparma strigata TaxID=1606541 RepID=A0A9W7BBU7_9STRA|nr:hypothetical protein TrST_g4790 [Triparma strigata]
MTSSEPPPFLPHPLILPDTTTRGLEETWTLGQNALSAPMCSSHLPQKAQAPPRSHGLKLNPTGELDVEMGTEVASMCPFSSTLAADCGCSESHTGDLLGLLSTVRCENPPPGSHRLQLNPIGGPESDHNLNMVLTLSFHPASKSELHRVESYDDARARSKVRGERGRAQRGCVTWHVVDQTRNREVEVRDFENESITTDLRVF